MSSEFKIISVAVPRPLDGLFTYRIGPEMAALAQVGGWVRVPFGRATTHAFVVEAPKNLSELPATFDQKKLKDVIEVGAAVFPADVMKLCRWASEYYRTPLGEVLRAAAPSSALGLKTARREARAFAPKTFGLPRTVELTPAQKVALAEIELVRLSDRELKAALLHGVTGSGKTEIYLEIARRTLALGKGVLLLVPEIALTPQLHQRFESGLATDVGLWHSAMADGKRRDLMSALLEGRLRVVVGARSAVFAPVPDLGLIVVDEEHDPTYKQEDRVRYHARDLALVRARETGACVVLGSATPSLESRERAREGRYTSVRLAERIGAGGMPEITLLNLCEEIRNWDAQAVLAEKTIDALRETLAAGQQAMVFLNRRGFAAFLVCQDCGEVKQCFQCSISLTMHKRAAQLRCHVCGHVEAIPDQCPKCLGSEMKPIGAGTESLEEDLPKLIPGAKILRLDRDQVTSNTRLEKILESFRAGEANILLGTQMLVKGHDFPGVTLVVVILADALFRWPDFRAPERALQILTQVAGRAGRGETPGKVLIQTFQPDHPVLQVVTGRMKEDEFLNSERELRSELLYPPFARLARVRFEAESRELAQDRGNQAVRWVEGLSPPADVHLLGPSEAFLEKAKGAYRWDILIKSKNIGELQRALWSVKDFARLRDWPILIDVDPYGVG